MTLNQLYYFQTIAKLQHYRQAALKLNISQPSLSRSMAGLEEELNIVLFEKHGRNIILTKYGKIFLEHVNKILDEVHTATYKMEQLSNSGGHIDIAYVFPLADYYIPHMVRSFLNIERHKDVTFNFNQLHTADMIAGLKAELFDVVFGSYVDNEPSIRFIPILHQEMVVITPHEHPLALQPSVSLQELSRYPIIGYDRYSGLGKFTHQVYKTHDLHPNIICESPDENAIASLVAEDFGIALVAHVNTIERANVCVLPLSDEVPEHTVYMAHLKDKYMIPSVRHFIRFIMENESN